MKILQICNKPPFPEADGGALAMASMAKSMIKNGYDLTILSMVTFKHGSSEKDIPEKCRGKVKFLFAEVDLRIRRWKALQNLFTSRSYHVERFISESFEKKLESLLKSNDFDVIQMETIFILPYLPVIRKFSKAKVMVRVHNIEHEVWQTTAEKEKKPFRKWYLRLLAKRLKVFELTEVNKADGIITISTVDKERLQAWGCTPPIINVPFAIDLNRFQAEEMKFPLTLFHLGAMDWIPNQIAIEWFLDNVFPRIVSKYKNVKFHIAGRKMPERFFPRKSSNLIVEGEVADAREFIRSKSLMIVPILSGSGMRTKIIEGMALGKCIISTPIGAAGIDYSNGENILIANSEEEYVNQISRCLDEPELASRIGRNARKLVEEKYSIEAVSAQLNVFLRSYFS